MAVRYPIISGNWSNALIWNGGTLPTSSDDVYANGFTVTIDQNITVLSLRTQAQSPAVAGGGFTVSGNFTINANFFTGTTTCLTYTGSGTLNIVGDIPYAVIQPSQNTFAINITGNGNVNIVGSIYSLNVNNRVALQKAGNGNLTITGNVEYNGGNVAGNISTIGIVSGNLYITGNLTTLSSLSGGCISNTGTGLMEVNGVLSNSSNSTLATTAISWVIISSTSSMINHIGAINNTANGGTCIFHNNSQGSVIATGPFVSASTAMMPLVVYRFFYRITLGSYFEFRDSSTNGALPPATPAPATRLVSPDTVVDAPIPSNVRNGVSYALGTFTGSLKVPNPNSVAFGVETDNTVGNAVLTPQAVWDYATSSLTTSGSIGERLKNASTVDTTGDQLAALL